MDKSTWGDPHIFRPERFLNEDETCFKPHLHVMSFGAGKRRCPDRILAEQQLFLITTNLIQQFHFSVPKGRHGLNESAAGGFVRAPKSFQIVINKR